MDTIKQHYMLQKIPDFSGNFRFGWLLTIDNELAEYWGDELVCQDCLCPMKPPIYFCSDVGKLYCSRCELSNIGKNLCELQGKDGHNHFKIIKINLMEENNVQNQNLHEL